MKVSKLSIEYSLYKELDSSIEEYVQIETHSMKVSKLSIEYSLYKELDSSIEESVQIETPKNCEK